MVLWSERPIAYGLMVAAYRLHSSVDGIHKSIGATGLHYRSYLSCHHPQRRKDGVPPSNNNPTDIPLVFSLKPSHNLTDDTFRILIRVGRKISQRDGVNVG
ncbi:hypothetical protein TNCV_2830811 [Trichonephila clavipes]|nr:hypothetical protein TNCV_2830811 [Trichonephila clavipes]